MKLYFAPMEGITGYVYRRAHHKYYKGVDKYFTPFVSPTKNKCFSNRERNDILPEHNEGMKVVPQILTNSSAYFIQTANALREYGYEEVNLNLGCPSGTVVTKFKGAGFLAKPQELEIFLAEIFDALDMKVSVKTRIGIEKPQEFAALLPVFNSVPLEELIIHPRCRIDMYQGEVSSGTFAYAYKNSKNTVCYNGDILTQEDIQKQKKTYPGLDRCMIGRGLLRNPTLCEEGAQGMDMERFRAFHEEVLQGYCAIMSGDRNTLFKMKELWFYMIQSFPGKEKYYKKIKKAESVSEYQRMCREFFLSF